MLTGTDASPPPEPCPADLRVLPASSSALNCCVALPRLLCCTAAGITGGLVTLYFALLLWMTCWVKVEAFFENTPWLRCGGHRQATTGRRCCAGVRLAPIACTNSSGCGETTSHRAAMDSRHVSAGIAARCRPPLGGASTPRAAPSRVRPCTLVRGPLLSKDSNSSCTRSSCGAGGSALTVALPSAELECAGYKPTLRCPSCDARVHDSAFHKTDRLVG